MTRYFISSRLEGYDYIHSYSGVPSPPKYVSSSIMLRSVEKAPTSPGLYGDWWGRGGEQGEEVCVGGI